MKKIMITGSCGFILGNFVRKAIYDQKKQSDRYSFVSVDRVNTNAQNSMYWNLNHKFYPADIRDQHVIDIIFQFEQPDIVIHGAEENDILSDNNSLISSNISGTQVIINACIKYKVNKLVYLSTSKVYGELLKETDPSWTEKSIINPKGIYAASKAAAELLIMSTSNLNYNIVRSCNNYGPRQSSSKLIPKTIKSILENKKMSLYGQGQHLREWMYVADHCSALMSIIEKGENNQIYNVSTNYEFSNLEVVNEVFRAMGSETADFVEFIPNNLSIFRSSINSDKIRNIGWKPSYKFKDGIKENVKWFLDNRWFLK